MTTRNPPETDSIEALLTAAQEDEQLQLCDELARGDKTAAEVDARLGSASSRIQRVRQMSEPLTAAQKDRLVALLLQAAPAQPTPEVITGGSTAVRPPARRTRALGFLVSGLAVAAALAVYVALPRGGEQLPVLALEVAESDPSVLGAPTPAGQAGMQVHPGSCLALRLRPERSHRAELQTSVWFVAKGAGAPQQPVPWPVQLHRTERGMFQMDACTRIPSAVGPGQWELSVVYGRELPPADVLSKGLSAGTAGAKWQLIRQPLDVVTTPP